jgi:tight adherence protein C
MLAPILISVLAGVAVLFIALALASPKETSPLQQRLAEYGARPLTLEELELSQPFSERVLKPLMKGSARFVTRFMPKQYVESTRMKLEAAGNPNNWSAADFLGVRGLAGAVMAAAPFLLLNVLGAPFSQRILFAILLGLLGFQFPVLWLGSKIRSRKTEILKAMPDALDLLTISVEAGLGFDAAMSKVNEKWDNELSRGFGRAIAEMRMGQSRRDALRAMAARMDVPEVTAFIAAVIQADQLGVSIAKVLRIQSEQMRIRRRQRAEEKAQQAPLKMTFPLVLLIFPSIYIILLGPAILILIHSNVFGTLF